MVQGRADVHGGRHEALGTASLDLTGSKRRGRKQCLCGWDLTARRQG